MPSVPCPPAASRDPAAPTPRLRRACPVLLLLGLSALLWLPRLNGPIDLRYDAGVYYVLGTSLADGRGYRLLNEPGEIEAVQYPPLLPAFVAAHQRALGTSDPGVVGRALRVSFFPLFTLYLLAAYALARPHLGVPYAFLVAVVCALSLHGMLMSDLLCAEVPFGLAATVFAVFNRGSNRLPYFLLTAGAGAAAFLLRTAGVALLAAWVVESLVRRKWRQALLRGAVAAAPVLGWQAYVGRVTAGEEYHQPAYAYQRAEYQFYNVTYAENVRLLDPFAPELGRASAADLVKRFGDNLAAMPTSLGEAVAVTRTPWTAVVTAVRDRTGVAFPLWAVLLPTTALGCAVVIGAGMFLARGEVFIPAYLAASVGLICLTPWSGQFPRYLTPLTPFLALCLVGFLRALLAYSRRAPSRAVRYAGVTGFAVAMALAVGANAAAGLYTYLFRHTPVHPPEAHGGAKLFYYDRTWAEFDAALTWLGERGERGETGVVATVAPHWTYLKTGRKAVFPPLEADPARAQDLLDSVPVTHVVLDELAFLDVSRRYAAPVVEKNPHLWRLVYSAAGGGVRVYQRVR
jgi:hypothetical protein